jgi:hypothetical protein
VRPKAATIRCAISARSRRRDPPAREQHARGRRDTTWDDRPRHCSWHQRRASPHVPTLQVAVGRAWEAALKLITDDESLYATALEAAHDIGTDYRDRPDGRRILDDTGQHLLLAQHLAGEGDFAAAARTARRVLHDRMAMYAKRFASIVE